MLNVLINVKQVIAKLYHKIRKLAVVAFCSDL